MRTFFVLAMFCLCVQACKKSSSEDRAASLERAQGTVELQKANKEWQPMSLKAWALVGDSVRTGASSEATLRTVDGNQIHVEPDTIVRFLRDQGNVQVDVVLGGLVLEAGPDGATFSTQFGTATLLGGSSAELRSMDGDLTLLVRIGEISLEPTDGSPLNLREDDVVKLNVSIGQLELEKATVNEDPDAGVPDAGVPDAAPDASQDAAELFALEVKGPGARIMKEGSWQKLPRGATTVPAGTSLSTRPGTSISLALGDKKAVMSGRAEGVTGAGDTLLTASSGNYVVTALDEDVAIRIPGGTVAALGSSKGSAASLSVGDSSEVSTKRGRVKVHGRAGSEVISIGESATLDKNGNLSIEGRAPEVVNLDFPAGESITVHSGKLPIAVRVGFADACPEEGVLEFAGRGQSFEKAKTVSSGTGSASAILSKGKFRYRIRCVGDKGIERTPKASGSISLVRDSGQRKLAANVTDNLIEADGRRYTVLYQSRLPNLTMSWPKAPNSSSFSLILEPDRGKTIKVSTKRASHRFKSGKIQEGTYTWWFEAGGRKSPKTSLTIDFDNAAPTAHFDRPKATESGSLRIRGAVLDDWKVRINNKPVELDRHNRFELSATPAAKTKGVAVRIAHPKNGIHYYLMGGN